MLLGIPCNLTTFLKIEISHLGGVISGVTRKEVSYHRKPINNHHNGVSLGLWKTGDKVQANVLPWGIGSGKRGLEALGKDVALS